MRGMQRTLRALLLFFLFTAAGFAADTPQAADWRKKAGAGDANSQELMGECYADDASSDGIPLDYAEAVKWYRLAAEQGNADAQNNLGYMYYSGNGVPKNLVQAHVWLNIAGANGNELAKKNLAIAEEEMTSEQKAEAIKMDRELHANKAGPPKNFFGSDIFIFFSKIIGFPFVIYLIYVIFSRALRSMQGNILGKELRDKISINTEIQDIAQVASGDIIDQNYLKKYVQHVAKKLELPNKLIPPAIFTSKPIYISKDNLRNYGDLLNWKDLENMNGQARGVYCCWLTADGGILKHHIMIHLEAGLHEVDYISVIAHEMRHCWQRVNKKCLDKPEHDAIAYQDWYMETGRFE